ncbi:MAG: hypothetical protein K0S41_1921 [Anaerocolumna sp.]|jgi:hypothetical protein|nr:hypothetical protein [Anaerocolumna sp.]
MISLKVVDIKAFMSSLLVHNVFDNFLVSELDIGTFNQFHISGKINEEFYSSDELEILGDRKYSTWSEVKPIAYTLLKGNKLPLSVKIVFLLSPTNTENVLRKSGLPIQITDINGLFLNIRYEKGILNLITGTSIKTFTMDKSLEHEWDANVKTFLKHYEIAVEENK